MKQQETSDGKHFLMRTAAATDHSELGSPYHLFLASMAAYVGLDPRKDLNWVIHPPVESMQLLAEEKVDAFMGFPPDPQELRAKQIGHVMLNKQHVGSSLVPVFLLYGGRKSGVCPEVPRGRQASAPCDLEGSQPLCAPTRPYGPSPRRHRLTQRYDYALQTLKDISHDRWPEYNPEDTMRFYALRLHEVGMIKSSPQKIIAEGTDWRLLNELKKELKG